MFSFSTVISEGPICRICHEGEQGGHLISPCRCTGTLRYLHKKCLEQWLQTRDKDVCELCNHEIRTRRRTRPLSEVGTDRGGDIFRKKLIVSKFSNLCTVIKALSLNQCYMVILFNFLANSILYQHL